MRSRPFDPAIDAVAYATSKPMQRQITRAM
jgi:hypothetical protein